MLEAVDIYYDSMTNSSSKVGIFLTDKDHRALRVIQKNVPNLIKQQILDKSIGIGTRRSNFFFKLMESVMVPAVEAGIPQYLLKYILEVHMQPLEDDPSEPKVFAFNDLSFGFVVWIITCGVALLAFVIELLWFYGKILTRNLTAMIILFKFATRGYL